MLFQLLLVLFAYILPLTVLGFAWYWAAEVLRELRTMSKASSQYRVKLRADEMSVNPIGIDLLVRERDASANTMTVLWSAVTS